MASFHTELILTKLEEAASFLHRANRSLREGNWEKFESDAVLSAHNGISVLEPILKDYLESYCRSSMSIDEVRGFDSKPKMPFLLSLMAKYSEPKLPKSVGNRLIRYQQIYNAAKHKNESIDNGETPAGFELKNALKAMCTLLFDYFPLNNEQKIRLSNIINKLDEISASRIQLDMLEVKRLLGAHIRLVDIVNFSTATQDEVKRYYEGTRLSWKIIVSGADVERDARAELITKSIEKNTRAKMLCLVGEPGAGKSTLAWRTAFEISSWTGHPLIQVLDNEDPNFWYNLEAVFPQFEIPLVILVDDVFRNNNVVRALENLNPDLSITIISTSQLNELPAQVRFPFLFTTQDVERPSRKEKERVFEKLHENHIFLDRDRRKRILAATSWWAMMLEATTGKELSSIVFDTIDKLKDRNLTVYSALEYVCYWGQYDVTIPSTVLKAINSSFFNIHSHSEGRGLILAYSNNSYYGTINSQFARIALSAYKAHDPRLLMDSVALV